MRHTHAIAATVTSCKLVAVLVFIFPLCALFSSTTAASASISPSTIIPSAVGVGIAVDGSEDESNKHDYDYDYDYDCIPWQPSPTNLQNVDEAARYEDMPPIVFSPTGRLHPVEAAFRASKAVTPLSNLLVAMRCRDGLVVMSTLPVSPHVDARIATSRNTNTHAHTHTHTHTHTAAAAGAGADDNTTRTDTSSSNDNDNCNDTSEHSFDGTGNATSASTTNNETANDDDDGDDSLYPSLFLFDETCTSTVTGPIFDIHPCIVGATAGNAVDNRIMRTKLLALGLNALEHQGASEEDVTPGRVAKDLANQLQVVTQDIAAAQKQKLGRMLASSALILGSQKIWRIDPTGQFWDCQATVVGEDADRSEEELYRRLLEECERKQFNDVRELLDSISQKEAFALLKDFLQSRMAKQQQTSRSPQTSSMATKPLDSSRTTNTESSAKKSNADDSPTPDLSSQIYWQAVILDYSSLTRKGTPRRKLKRGIFGVRNQV